MRSRRLLLRCCSLGAVSLVAACFGSSSSSSSDAGIDFGADAHSTFDAPSHEGLPDGASHDGAADSAAQDASDSTLPTDAAGDAPAVTDSAGAEASGDTGTVDAGNEAAVDSGPVCVPAPPDPAKGVFVDGSTGSDSTGDGSMAKPYQTIGHGIQATALAGTPNVYVAPGTYAESLAIPAATAGVFVRGGWTVSAGVWQTDCAAAPESRTIVQGGQTAVEAADITAPSGLSSLTVLTEADATSIPGGSLLGVFVHGTNATFLLDDVVVASGIAGPGRPSTYVPPQTGVACGACTASPANGSTPAPGPSATAQGTFSASGFTPADGHPGAFGSNGTTGTPPGTPGTITYNSGCSGGCFFPCSTLTSQATGTAGSCGCGGKGGNPGVAGSGGGASAAVVLQGTGASVAITRSALTAGNGGQGSPGSAGGAPASGTSGSQGTQNCVASVTCGYGLCIGGQYGGCGQFPTTTPECAAGGTTGGTGATGGAGSAGGGGAGGPSYALVTAGGATASVDGATTLAFGQGGTGAGGAPNGGAAAQATK
jgi:hypothetical protein